MIKAENGKVQIIQKANNQAMFEALTFSDIATILDEIEKQLTTGTMLKMLSIYLDTKGGELVLRELMKRREHK